MSAPLNLDGYIKKELEEKPLSGKEITERIIDDPNAPKPKKPKESFNEAYDRLLKAGKIGIYGYSSNDKRIQNINSDLLIFYLVKKEPNEIFQLINKVISKDDVNSYNELRGLFIDKIEEIDSTNVQRWEFLIDKVEKRAPTYKELLWYSAYKMIIKQKTQNREYYDNIGLEGFYIKINEKMDELKQYEKEISNKCNQTYLIQLKIPKKEIIDPLEIHEESFNPMPNSIFKKHLFNEKNMSEKEFLNVIDFNEPKKRDYNNINNLFEIIISYINSRESGKASLIDRLSRGLCKQENSNDILNEFVYESTNKKESLIINYKL